MTNIPLTVSMLLLVAIGGFLLLRHFLGARAEPPKGNCPICGVSLSYQPSWVRLIVDGRDHDICLSCSHGLDRHPEWIERLKERPAWEVKVEGTDSVEVARVMNEAVAAISQQNLGHTRVASALPTSNEPGDVFISYAREDRPRASALAKSLETRGWSVWWDPRIPLGNSFDQVIERALSSAICVIVLWSRHSVLSDWVKAEASEGKRRGILVPARIEEVEIPLEFRRMQTADLTRWDGDTQLHGWVQLCEAVETQVHSNKQQAGDGLLRPSDKPDSKADGNSS